MIVSSSSGPTLLERKKNTQKNDAKAKTNDSSNTHYYHYNIQHHAVGVPIRCEYALMVCNIQPIRLSIRESECIVYEKKNDEEEW